MRVEFRYQGMAFFVEGEGALSVSAAAERGGAGPVDVTGGCAVEEAPEMVYEAEVDLLARLVSLRRQLAAEEGVPPFVVFQDKALREMTEKRPKDLSAFSEITGVGRIRLEKYGERFISLIRGAA